MDKYQHSSAVLLMDSMDTALNDLVNKIDLLEELLEPILDVAKEGAGPDSRKPLTDTSPLFVSLDDKIRSIEECTRSVNAIIDRLGV